MPRSPRLRRALRRPANGDDLTARRRVYSRRLDISPPTRRRGATRRVDNQSNRRFSANYLPPCRPMQYIKDAESEVLDSYIRWYNATRIKVSLGSLCPLEYRQSLGIAA
jgi:hypothetical protein